MPLSWNEIKDRSIAFSKEWAEAKGERAEAQTFWNEFFGIFGIRRRSVALYEEKVTKLGGNPGYIDLFWPGTLLVEHKDVGKDLNSAFLQATDYVTVIPEHERPRYVIVSDFRRMRLYDLEAENKDAREFECGLKELPKHIHAFGFIAGYTKRVYKDEEAVNVKAAVLVAKLHDALRTTGYHGHELEILLVRLVFCFFADDTDIFGERGAFRNFIETRTGDDGSDLGPRLAQLFQVLNTPKEKRQTTLDEELREFPHVDGHIFEEQLPLPAFDTDMREQLLKCTAFDWASISPAVFGAMFQSAMDPDKRHELGAHYTSEKNILKVISGLFLDDLKIELKAIGNHPAKLRAFHEKLAGLKFLDPACGCGNFLVVTYRELRLLETEILIRLFSEARERVALPQISTLAKIDVDCMYGIEIEELPANIASLALWLTDHQMNMRLSEEFGQYYARLPLAKRPTIVRGNALRLDWNKIVPREQLNYIFGNPPFSGSRIMTPDQKIEMKLVFNDIREVGFLDYVTAWYRKAAELITGTSIRAAFVSTNSITQGEQVGILWDELNKFGIKIHFAHKTFKWTNEAHGVAAVYCVIIGFAAFDTKEKYLFDYESITGEPHVRRAKNINPYLVDADDFLIRNRQHPLKDVPEMSFGNMPRDGGNLLLADDEKRELLNSYPEAAPFVRAYVGAQEFLHNETRWCLWLVDADPSAIKRIPPILERIEKVRAFRLASKAASTQRMAQTPGLFAQRTQPVSDYILIPGVSSERRRYIPMALFSKEVIVSNLCHAIPNGTLFHLGVLHSEMHMAWVRQVCGRLKSDYRYSKDIVYNNFPWPESPTTAHMKAVEDAAKAVLDARKEFPNATLADLYDPDTMPEKLLKAHKTLDAAADRCYGAKKFPSELDRLKFLFSLYSKMVDAR